MIDGLIVMYVFLIGLVFGSFFNVVGLRVPNGQSIIAPRSHCPSCKRTLTGIDLIPVVSYIFLRGKCRTCEARVSPLSPTIELVTACLYVGVWLVFGWSTEVIVAWIFVSLLVIITVSDLSTMLIPNKILLFFGTIIFLFRLTIAPLHPWWDVFVGAAVGFSLLLIIAIVSKGGMGGGDIKLFAVLGMYFGWQDVLLAFFFSVFVGAVIGGIGLLIGKVKRKSPMPFGPAIAIGSVLTLFFGEEIVAWYLSFLT